MAEFKVGDRVRGISGEELTIVSRPVAPVYRVRYRDGAETYASADVLRPAPTDPRVAVVAETAYNLNDRNLYTWGEVGENVKGRYLADATAILAALDAHDSSDQAPVEDTAFVNGVTYVLGVEYEDRDGDRWLFKRTSDGYVRDAIDGVNTARSDTLPQVVALYGPLTRVT